mgnify:CR=1 FL=1
MSGGIDSTAAAALLKKKGWDIAGITFSLWDGASRCCNYDDIMDAKRACVILGIRHYTVNLKPLFKKKVVDYFIDAYISGKTPNPCVVCNAEAKFAGLIKKADEAGFDYVATGHYARISRIKGGFTLKKAADKNKSQEYFLARLGNKTLARAVFPLGGVKKSEAKKISVKCGINPDKKESQEACFLREGESPYDFIQRVRPQKKTGNAVLYTTEGKKIAELGSPYYRYTVGQRKGLGIGGGKPLYVAAVDAGAGKVLAGGIEEIHRKRFRVSNLNMYVDKGKSGRFSADVKIRYRHAGAKARVITGAGAAAEVVFEKPQFAVAPGQLAVFYDKDTVIGSGFIE